MARILDLHYRGWLIRCSPYAVASGWCGVVEVWRPWRDRKETGEAIPFTAVFSDAADVCVEGIEAEKKWIDARYEQ